MCNLRDPATILPEKIAGALLTALDNENDGAIAAQIQATLQTLLRAGAGAAPSYWLSVCSSVALSAPAAAPRVSGGGRQSGSGVLVVLVWKCSSKMIFAQETCNCELEMLLFQGHVQV